MAAAAAALAAAAAAASAASPATVSIGAAVAHSAPGYVSFNFDWHKNSEESPVWINMSVQLVDFANPLLGQAADSLAPGHLRIGGSEEDDVIYDVPEFGSTCAGLNVSDAAFCLSMTRWTEIAGFAQKHGLRLVFGLDAMQGRRRGNSSTPLNLTNHEALLRYTKKQKLPVYGFELGNELPKVPAAVMAADYRNLKALLTEIWPDAASRPKLIGCDQNVNVGYLKQWLPLVADVLDVVTYHHYDGYGLDEHLADKIMTPSFLDGTKQPDVVAAWRQYAPHAELWVGEGAAAWHSGRAGVTNAFVDNFWYADALAGLARENHTCYQRQTLLGGSYGLLNRTTYAPNPDYWVGKLHHDLMGPRVLEVSVSGGDSGVLRAYAQCTPGGNGKVTLLLMNIDSAKSYGISTAGAPLAPRDEYVLSAKALSARTVLLNGAVLEVVGGRLPELKPQSASGELMVPPRTVGYYVLRGPVAACKGA
eukprot:TRINITY_DN11833_c0_g1_i1.p1 TRINITY_DN11833_c0_g1~~TRINITY_DN11833_c0_g1_i1.p1  ORF type:complete len:499 (+),score=151.95 TRINITY_DN11833_c0_g1_i1:69-1499(+)